MSPVGGGATPPRLGSNGMSARESVYRYLRQRIVTGEYGGGIRLVEEQVADELGVSRTPIREALQRLTSDGLVVRVRRGQLEVVAVDERAREELHDIRVAFDQVGAQRLTDRVGEISWEPLYALLPPLGDAHRDHGFDSPQFAIAHLDLHIEINRAAFSPVTSAMLERQVYLYPTDDYVQQPGYEPESQHRRLLDELSSGDLERAQAAARWHAVRGPAPR